METHLTASAVSLRERRAPGRTSPAVDPPSRAVSGEGRRAGPRRNDSQLALAAASARAHTLVLEGELHRRSAAVLEAEIERLCEDGVAAITLDLRELSYIDSIGIAVIAFRSGLCKRRGHDFTVVIDSPFLSRALRNAGVTELGTLDATEVVAG